MINDRLRATRISRNKSLQQMADEIYVSLRSYQRYESGDKNPPYDKLLLIADILSVPIDFLFGRDDYLKFLGVSVDVSLDCPPRRPKPHKNR